MILRLLVENPGLSQREIMMQLGSQPEKIEKNLKELQDEGFLKSMRKRYTIL
jgi:predicted transcriptional regulator